MDATHDMEGTHDPPQYPGDDTRPTSKKEISGFYSYGFAAEVFVICGIGSFVPIALEQLSRERGFLLSDRTKPCKGSSIDLSTPGPDHRHSTFHSRSPKAEAGQCIITILGADVNTASFAMYTFSISVLIQALLIISMSAAADHGRSRKSFLLSFAFTGAVATMLFLAIAPEFYLLGALLAVIANTCFGASFVLLNSFLPILVRRELLPNFQYCLTAWSALGDLSAYEALATFYPRSANANRTGHPTIRRLCFDEQNEPVQHGPSILVNGHERNDRFASDESAQALLKPTLEQNESRSSLSKEKVSPALRLSTQISSYGIGIGYFAAVIVQTLGIIIVIVVQPLTKSTTLPLRLALFVIGLWWLVFTIPSALWLRPRPGPPLPSAAKQGQGRSWVGYSAYAWKSLWKTILRARHLKDVMLFLAAWFLLSDSIATISGTAVLFAKTDLQMKPAALALISLTGTVVGVIGAFSWGKISRTLNLKPSQTIIACKWMSGALSPPDPDVWKALISQSNNADSASA